MGAMSGDPLELNWLAFAAALITPEQRSIDKVLGSIGLAIPYEKADADYRRRRDAEIVRRHKAGQRAYTIAAEMGIHRQKVYNALHNMGITLRKPKYGEGRKVT